MSKPSAQKFISRNRKPRVHIEYETFVGNAQAKVELPFVMGVMSDLSGDSKEPLAPVKDRKFMDIDTDNFDERMKSMKPRVAFAVPNALTGEGNLPVDITFEKMEDFSPAAIARKVDGLKELLETRDYLKDLTTKLDGKDRAEDLLAKLLDNPSLLKALATKPGDDSKS